MRKFIYFVTVLEIISCACLTGCGEGEEVLTESDSSLVSDISVSTNSSMESVAEAYAKAYWESDGELMMSIIPEIAEKNFEDVYDLTEEEIKNKVIEYFSDGYNTAFKDFEIVETKETSDYEYINKILNENYNISYCDKFYYITAGMTVYQMNADENFNGEVYREIEIMVFEYDGKWYSHGALQFIDMILG